MSDLGEINPDAVTWDGFDSALVGYGYRCGMEPVALYDRGLMLAALTSREGMTWEDAEEYLSFNVEGAWVGPGTPIIAVIP
tara:strand:+ start:1190 stop:1432 length:243 start_codon:yes stop_codon:yes gene_type:complete